MWFDDNSCLDLVRKSWTISTVGSPTFRLVTIIKNVKQDLRIWNRENFGNCFNKAKELKLKLDAMQYLDKTDSNGFITKNLQEELDTWLHRADIYWRQKAKEKWIKDGDANKRYFHLTAVIHSKYNKIDSLLDSNNLITYDRTSIGNSFVNFYSKLFQSDFDHSCPPFPKNLDNLMTTCITSEDNAILTAIPSNDEIKKVLFSFAKFKSPGPDGDLLASVTKNCKDHWISMAKSKQGLRFTHLSWKPPPELWTKVNVDAAFSNGCAFTGMVFRNSQGSIIFSAAHKHNCIDSTAAKSLALLDVCKELEKQKITNVLLESDCLNAITFINMNPLICYWTAAPIIEKIRSYKLLWINWNFKSVHRLANRHSMNLLNGLYLVILKGLFLWI
ncbi:hypothetical protein CASFOL_037640 [Castilleja foliolosa]|uniref:RNase H type-1 domain-containing protein n=1 Tax=Castilleja foliolosa TaxID=1961234 RepID=A0ABD3BMY2_9LAMI